MTSPSVYTYLNTELNKAKMNLADAEQIQLQAKIDFAEEHRVKLKDVIVRSLTHPFNEQYEIGKKMKAKADRKIKECEMLLKKDEGFKE